MGISIYGTDQLSYTRVNLKAKIKKKIPPMLLTLSHFSQYVDIWTNNVNLSVKGNYVIIKSGQDKVKLPLNQGGKDFKGKFPNFKRPSHAVRVDYLPTQVRAVSYAVSSEKEQSPTSGIHLQKTKQNFIVEAADGFHYVRFVNGNTKGKPMDSVVHQKIGQLIPRLPSPGYLWHEGSFVFYECSLGTVAIVTTQYDSYPNLEKLATREKKCQMTVKRSEINSLYKKSSIIAANRVFATRNGKNSLSIRSENKDSDGSRELVYEGVVEAEFKGKFPDIVFDVNHIKFLADLYSSDNVVVNFGGSEDNIWSVDGDMQFLTTPYGSL